MTNEKNIRFEVIMCFNELLNNITETNEGCVEKNFEESFDILRAFCRNNKDYNYDFLTFTLNNRPRENQALKDNIINMLFEDHDYFYNPVVIGKEEICIGFQPQKPVNIVSFEEIEKLMSKTCIKTLHVNFSRRMKELNAYIQQNILIKKEPVFKNIEVLDLQFKKGNVELKEEVYKCMLKKDLDLENNGNFTYGFTIPEYFLSWDSKNKPEFNNKCLNINNVLLDAEYFFQEKEANKIILFDSQQLYLASLLFCDSRSRLDYILDTKMKEIISE